MRTEDILKDGESVRVPMTVMDARDAYVASLGDAWRKTTLDSAHAARGGDDRDVALAQRAARLRDAWKGGAR